MTSSEFEKMPDRRTRSLCTEKLQNEHGNDPVKTKVSWSKSNEEHTIEIDQTVRYQIYQTSGSSDIGAILVFRWNSLDKIFKKYNVIV